CKLGTSIGCIADMKKDPEFISGKMTTVREVRGSSPGPLLRVIYKWLDLRMARMEFTD
ncbi:hypothetical protein QZH41_008562, partial [Actinostola sp. cb2023]